MKGIRLAGARRAWIARALALLALALLAVDTILLFTLKPWRLNVETGGFWLDALVNMGAPVLGLVIALRQPSSRYGWLWLVYGITAGVLALILGIYYLNGSRPTGYPLPLLLLLWMYFPVTLVSVFCLPLFVLWFPTGEPSTRRWRFLHAWLAVAFVLMITFAFARGTDSRQTVAIENPFGFIPQEVAAIPGTIGWFGFVLANLVSAASFLFRYRRAASVERQQIKWFLLGAAGLASTFVLTFVTLGSDVVLLVKIYNDATLLLVYGVIGIAILRYRLFDIDIVIRRTLTYAVLTALLLLVYFGSVVVLQQLFTSVTGTTQSELVTVLSTLGIAALFIPLRARIQGAIDRRFNRRKYDAQQVLEQFGRAARDETDLSRLTGRLIEVVHETMQPQSVSLELKPDDGSGRGRAR